MTQPIVAALQMTSLADVGRNLVTAKRLLREARDQGACLAVLPENFSFMGRNEAERPLALFAFGRQKAAEHGLTLVDTKCEMGRDADGRILLIDELHTPDSSRYWLADGYEARLAAGLEPENVDKEFLRLWFAEHCDPYHDATLPPAPDDLVIELSRRYIFLYEKITGLPFAFPDAGVPVAERIARNLAEVA